MALTIDDLHAFHRFAQARVASDGADSLHQLVDLWEIDHPMPEVHRNNVSAVQAAIRDMENGDAGRSAKDLIEELRIQLTCRDGQ